MLLRKFFKLTLLLLIMIATSSCSVWKTQSCSQKTQVRLYFGATTPDGQVSDEQWKKFVKEEITPSFPAGLTTIEGKGQWLGANNVIVNEISRIVEIVYDNSQSNNSAIDRIVTAYKSKYKQEAVLELRSMVYACLS